MGKNKAGLHLDDRLSAVAALVARGQPAADIGTDHGYVAAQLILEQICPLVIATDRAAAPLASARQLVERLGLQQRVSLRQGDGLSVLQPGEAHTLIVAGMGGRLICRILDDTPAVTLSAGRLVLQPQKDAELVRGWLEAQGWLIVAEELARDGELFYQVLAAEPGQMRLNAEQRRFGPCLLERPHPLLGEWLRHLLAADSLLLDGLAEQPGAAAQQRRSELAADADLLKSILTRI